MMSDTDNALNLTAIGESIHILSSFCPHRCASMTKRFNSAHFSDIKPVISLRVVKLTLYRCSKRVKSDFQVYLDYSDPSKVFQR